MPAPRTGRPARRGRLVGARPSGSEAQARDAAGLRRSRACAGHPARRRDSRTAILRPTSHHTRSRSGRPVSTMPSTRSGTFRSRRTSTGLIAPRIASATRPSTRASRARSPHRPPASTSTMRWSRDSRRPASAGPRSRCTSATARSSRFASIASRIIRSIPNDLPSLRRPPAAINDDAGRRPPHRGRGHDDDAGARERGGRGRPRRGTRRCDRPVHPSRLSLPRRRRASDELPPAAGRRS